MYVYIFYLKMGNCDIKADTDNLFHLAFKEIETQFIDIIHTYAFIYTHTHFNILHVCT